MSPDDRDHETLDDPYRTCEYGHHTYRLISLGPDGTDEGAVYRCEDCGDEDPEGSQAA